jgi:hypothetical protein
LGGGAALGCWVGIVGAGVETGLSAIANVGFAVVQVLDQQSRMASDGGVVYFLSYGA